GSKFNCLDRPQPGPAPLCSSSGRPRGIGANCFLALGPMLSWSITPRQVMRRIDQSDVRERLREIADLPAGSRVVFLRQQSNIVAQVEKPLEHQPGVGIPALQDVVIGEPEAASEEGPFVAGQAVDSALGIVARDKAIPQQKLLYGSHRADDAEVISG